MKIRPALRWLLKLAATPITLAAIAITALGYGVMVLDAKLGDE